VCGMTSSPSPSARCFVLGRSCGRCPGGGLVEALERGPGPSKGDAAAPVTLVEFSDFQCSYCRKFWRDTLPGIEEKYIRTGKVRFVYRHLAILGAPSVEAAIAAECADQQGKFWRITMDFASGGSFEQRRRSKYVRSWGWTPHRSANVWRRHRHRKRWRGRRLWGAPSA
jgi:hypothetical protein